MNENQSELLSQIFDASHIVLRMNAKEKDEAFEELVNILVSEHDVQDSEEVLAALRERESKMSTGISRGIAIPHCKLENVDQIIGVLGFSAAGIDYDALDKKPVHLIFLFISPKANPQAHLDVLSKISRLVEQTDFYDQICLTRSSAEANLLLEKYEHGLS